LLVIGIFIGLILRAYFSKKKYLTNLIITDDIITIQFTTSLFKSKTLQVRVPDTNELRLSLDGFRYSALGVLKLKANELTHNLIIINNKVLKTTKQQITTAKSGFKKVGPDFYLSSVKPQSSGVLK